MEYALSRNYVEAFNGNRVLLFNSITGKSIKISKECHDVIKLGLDRHLSEEQLISALEEKEDKEYFGKLFRELRDSGIIIEKGQREPWKVEFVNVDITHRCNLSCIHCSMNAASLKEKERISTEDWKKIFDRLISIQPSSITISGGEPLIRKDIWELLEYLKAGYHGKLSVMTNGLLIHQENVDRLIGIFDDFNISLDGVDEETCSKIRGKGVFGRVMNTVELLQSRGADRISLSMVDVSYTHNYVERFKKLNEELGTYAMVRAFEPSGRGEANKEQLNIETKTAYDELMEYAKIIGSEKRQRDRGFSCGAARTEFHIDSFGDLYPCAPLEYEEFKLGNLLEIENFYDYIIKEQYIQSSGYQNIEALMPHKNAECKKCSVNMFCWSCLHDLYQSQKKTDFIQKCSLKKKELQCMW